MPLCIKQVRMWLMQYMHAHSLRWSSQRWQSLSSSGRASLHRTTRHGLRERRYSPEHASAPTIFCYRSSLPTQQGVCGASHHSSDVMLPPRTYEAPPKSTDDECLPGSLQHLIIDGSPKWDIYRTVPVASTPRSSAAASTPQAVKREAVPAPPQRDALLDAATAGGVLLGSGNYTFQVTGIFAQIRVSMHDSRPASTGHFFCSQPHGTAPAPF